MNTSTSIDINSLPVDVFDLKHEHFYNFITDACGPVQSAILKFQLISDADTFIECNDPTEILKYDHTKLNELKDSSCLITADKSCIILPGIIASFNSLKKRLLKQIDENIKETKRNKSINNVFTPTPSTTSANSQSKTIDDFRNHIIKSIDQWLDKYKNDLNLEANCSLAESVDYTIEFGTTRVGQQSAVVTCKCGSKSSLCRNSSDGFYKVSIYEFCL